MAGLLNTTPQYVNPQAQILYGSGNAKVSDADIKAFISAPGRTAAEIQGAALVNNINTDQISRAMGGKDAFAADKIDSYLAGQGITKELRPEAPKQNLMQAPAVVAQNATYTPAIQDPIKGTVAGQLEKNLDPESPLMKRAATFGNQQTNARGLLNSSIGIGAAQNAMVDAGLQIATPDANSNNAFGLTNADAQNKISMFNSDLGSRVGMFNSGTQKDLNIAQLDTNNKLAIANIQAMANDAGIMGDQMKTMMSMYQQTMADPNITPAVKAEMTNNFMAWTKQLGGILPSISTAGADLGKLFGGSAPTTNQSSSTTPGSNTQAATTSRNDGAVATAGVDGKVGSFGSIEPDGSGAGYKIYAKNGLNPVVLNSKDYQFTASEITGIKASMNASGLNVDLNDIAPQSLIDEINRMQGGQTAAPDPRFFVPVPISGSMRGDNLAFSLYKAAVPKYQ